jgi:2-C-methyl-D-erythritol 4-phosphate cytidylyltransferase
MRCHLGLKRLDWPAMKAFAIIPAAGLGKRFGSKKQFKKLREKPLLLYTLQPFEDCSSIDGVILVVPKGEETSTEKLVSKAKLRKIIKIVTGGKNRQESVHHGFKAIPPCDVVVVHDGVRPFVTVDLIQRSIEGAIEFGGCIVGLAAKETTKSVSSSGFVEETVDRTKLWNIQTPQSFCYEIFKKAIDGAATTNFVGTDEAMLVEKIGEQVKVIEGSPRNIKITKPDDWDFALGLLNS